MKKYKVIPLIADPEHKLVKEFYTLKEAEEYTTLIHSKKLIKGICSMQEIERCIGCCQDECPDCRPKESGDKK